MNVSAFLFELAVALAAGLALTVMLAVTHGVGRYVGRIIGDLRAAWKSRKADDYYGEKESLDRAGLKGTGCLCLLTLIQILLLMGVIVFAVVASLTGYWR